MNFETIEGILNINLNSTMTLALAAVLLIIGYSINKRLTILNKYCIPAPVVGGFLFMFLTWLGHISQTFKFNFENIFQSTFMLAFFTTVGLGATPSAIVNMTTINEKYGMSRKAMMIVPIVGAFLVDIIYQPVTIWFIKTFVNGFVGN